jgi:hypothetical protein
MNKNTNDVKSTVSVAKQTRPQYRPSQPRGCRVVEGGLVLTSSEAKTIRCD